MLAQRASRVQLSKQRSASLHSRPGCIGKLHVVRTQAATEQLKQQSIIPASALPAAAEDAAASSDAAEASGFGPSTLLVLLPLVLYGVFNVYRTNANPKATFNDFLFLCAGLAVIGNIISIVVFKVRYF